METHETAHAMVECENLVKIYKTKDLEVLALQGLELTIEKGELMAIIGNSGSGNSDSSSERRIGARASGGRRISAREKSSGRSASKSRGRSKRSRNIRLL